MSIASPKLAAVASAVAARISGQAPAGVIGAAVDALVLPYVDPAAVVDLDPEIPTATLAALKSYASARAATLARARGDLVALDLAPASPALQRAAGRGLYELVLLGLRDHVAEAAKLGAQLQVADLDQRLAAAAEDAGAVVSGLWDLAPPVVFAGVVTDAAAGVLPEPLRRAGAAVSSALPWILGLGLGAALLGAVYLGSRGR